MSIFLTNIERFTFTVRVRNCLAWSDGCTTVFCFMSANESVLALVNVSVVKTWSIFYCGVDNYRKLPIP